ncbi:MAG: hypothetical protein ABIT01_14735 [Thermoanaerobaculia bacterium]
MTIPQTLEEAAQATETTTMKALVTHGAGEKARENAAKERASKVVQINY